MKTRALSLAALLPVLSLLGCPKDDHGSSAKPEASPTASSSGMTAGPSSLPIASPKMEPTPAAADPAPAAAGETVINYRWSGGLSVYQYQAMTIRGTDTAKVSFRVKPIRTDEKQVEDTLDAAQFAELKSLFDKVDFDAVGQKPRGVRILDIGQSVISREGGGHPRKEVMTNGQVTLDRDIGPLQTWLDSHVRTYLDRAGVGLKQPGATPAASATPK